MPRWCTSSRPRSRSSAPATGRSDDAPLPEVGDGVVPEHPADHRGALQHSTFGAVEAVEPRLQHALEGRRHAHLVDAVHPHVPRVVPPDDDTGVDEPGDELLDVEGVALGAVDHEVGQLGRHLADVLEELTEQQTALPARQRFQRQPGVVREPFAPVRT